MKKQDKKEEEQIQNRREFFKNAAKKALPIIAIAALSSMPLLSKAVEKENPQECSTCYTGCYGSCEDQCVRYCTHTCRGYCSGECKGYCKFTCKNNAY
jgi:CXXX repeat radical SAM target protein